MKEQNEPEFRSTLYLDIDGVILPTSLPEPEFYNTPNADLAREWVSPTEYYHPEVVEALGREAIYSLVVLASSRMDGFLHDSLYDDLAGRLNVKAALFIDRVRPGAIDLKLDAVSRHWGGVGDIGLEGDLTASGRGRAFTLYGNEVKPAGRKAVWAEDHLSSMPVSSLGRLQQLTDYAGMGLVAPRSSTGLTLADVERIGSLLRS